MAARCYKIVTKSLQTLVLFPTFARVMEKHAEELAGIVKDMPPQLARRNGGPQTDEHNGDEVLH